MKKPFLRLTHLTSISLVKKEDESLDPADVGFLGEGAQVACATDGADSVERA